VKAKYRAGPAARRGRTSGALACRACDGQGRTHAPQPSELLSRGGRRGPWLWLFDRSSKAEFGRPCRRAACIRRLSLCAPRRSAASRPARGRLEWITDSPKLRLVCSLWLVVAGVGPPAPGHTAPALGRHSLRSFGELVASPAPPSSPRPGSPGSLPLRARPARPERCQPQAVVCVHSRAYLQSNRKTRPARECEIAQRYRNVA